MVMMVIGTGCPVVVMVGGSDDLWLSWSVVVVVGRNDGLW